MGSLAPAQLRQFDFTSKELTEELRRLEASIRKRASKDYRRAKEGLLIETKEIEEEFINRRLTEELSPLLDLIEEVETQEAGGLKEAVLLYRSHSRVHGRTKAFTLPQTRWCMSRRRGQQATAPIQE